MTTETIYSAVNKDSDWIYEPPADMKQHMREIMKILHNNKNKLQVSEYTKAGARNANIDFLRGRLQHLQGENYYRALRTMQNLRQ